jgi:hypothetical protein
MAAFLVEVRVRATGTSYAQLIEELERRLRTGLDSTGKAIFYQGSDRDRNNVVIQRIEAKEEMK